MQRPTHDQKPLSYSEILRAIGQYVDRNNLSEIRILETDEGIVMQGLVMQGDKVGERMTYEVSVEDIQDLFHDSYAQRGREIVG